MIGTSIKTGKLIITGIAAAADPSGLVVTGAALDGANHLYDTLSGQNPKLDKLAAELGKAFHQRLATPAFDKPDDARTLLPQMFEHAITQANTQANFAHHGLDPGPILDDMCTSFAGHPDWRDEHIKAFRALLLPLLTQACNDPRLEAALRPALTRTATRRQKAQDQSAAQTHEKLDTILERLSAADLDRIPALSRDALELLASRFELPDPHAHSDESLRQYLTTKAQEYRSYRQTIAQLDDRVAAVANLKGAAQDAAERLDFEEVETLLARVTEVEAGIFAETLEVRAENALLRNKPDQAFTLLSAAADAFAGVAPFEPARRRLGYEELLYQHGLRYGGPGLPLSARMSEDALTQLTVEATPWEWAAAQNSLALALNTQAERTAGEAGLTFLTHAVDAYQAALTVATRDAHPLDWATTQQNLANALQTQATRTAGDPGLALLTRAIDAYEAALTVRTREDHPLNWATTQQNLAAALQTQATRTAGAPGLALLTRAINAYEAALTVRTREDHPLDWARTQQNLANALATQATRTAGDPGFALFTRAIDAYKAALTVFTRDDHPLNWVITQENLAMLHYVWSQRDGLTDPGAHLTAALSHIDAALSVYDPQHTSYDHETAIALRAKILTALDALPGTA